LQKAAQKSRFCPARLLELAFPYEAGNLKYSYPYYFRLEYAEQGRFICSLLKLGEIIQPAYTARIGC
jgi:hypothetical protein